MDKRKSKSESNDDEVRKIDLTLKLGPSLHCKEEESGDTANNGGLQPFSESSNHTGSSSNIHQGGFPLNVATTPPNRKRPIVEDIKVCKACGANTTPLWRKGPDGPQTLCNACGLRHLRTIKRGGE